MTLVVPSVSIGNVPQLAIDLLIHTYGFKLDSSLDDEFLCPVAGPADSVAGEHELGVATPVQLYTLPDKSISLIQLRSPTVPGGKLKFAESLREQLGATNHKDVLILGSANRGMRLDMDADLWTEERDPETPLPESGIVKQLLTVFSGSTALIDWTYEGDNISDAEAMAHRVAKKLGLAPLPLKQPVSWSRVYGKDVPLGVEKGIYT